MTAKVKFNAREQYNGIIKKMKSREDMSSWQRCDTDRLEIEGEIIQPRPLLVRFDSEGYCQRGNADPFNDIYDA